jgi:hypothetical protein
MAAVARVFDPAPHRNVGQPFIRLSPELTNQVIAAAVELGVPRALAEEARHNGYRLHDLALLWYVVDQAAKGNPGAAAARDRIRVSLANAANIGEALAALEQPADPGELQSLMGLD